jgi:ABC-2 type transport system ATP-binding protein
LIETRRLARWYGAVVGVTDVSVTIPGATVGLLGPNGAGKSTFLKLVTGQIRPSSGSLSVFGRDPMSDPAVFRDVGYCSEDDALFEDLTPLDMVRYLARLHGMDAATSRRAALGALETCGIAARAGTPCRELSKGQRQRVRIAAAIVHEPRLLILDEPMTGLDPVGRRAIIDLIRARARAGLSVVFSSHILHEVESVATYVVVLNKGMVLAEGTIGHIREALSDDSFTVEIAGAGLRPMAERLVGREHVTAIEWLGDGVIRVSSRSAKALTTEVPAIALDVGAGIESIATPDESLEALFGRLVARRPS